MDLFQELVFTITFSLIVSLLIVKLISAASTSDDGNSTVEKKRVEEKIEKEWVVCDSDKRGNAVWVQDPVKKVIKEVDLGSGVVIGGDKSVGGVDACQVFDESPERVEVEDDGGDLVGNEESNVVGCIGSLIQENCGNSVGGEDEGFEDDWQGIETTELEKRFGAAVAFVDSNDRVNSIDDEVKRQLYGLHRVAIEGSCFEPQPMALKVSARANWNSWKRLENLEREEAMEQYIALLSQHVPDWMGRHAYDKQ